MSDCGSPRRAWDFLRLIAISCEQAELYRLLGSQLDSGRFQLLPTGQCTHRVIHIDSRSVPGRKTGFSDRVVPTMWGFAPSFRHSL